MLPYRYKKCPFATIHNSFVSFLLVEGAYYACTVTSKVLEQQGRFLCFCNALNTVGVEIK